MENSIRCFCIGNECYIDLLIILQAQTKKKRVRLKILIQKKVLRLKSITINVHLNITLFSRCSDHLRSVIWCVGARLGDGGRSNNYSCSSQEQTPLR